MFDMEGVPEIKNNKIREIPVDARFICNKGGANKLILTAKEYINTGEIEIVSAGENGKTLPINVKSASSVNAECKVIDGRILLKDIKANVKIKIEFHINGDKKYAMGVRAYGN